MFFVFGAPKSGTTWMQMLLDAHPDVCCRGEDTLDYFIHQCPEFLERYNSIRVGVNERTAKHELIDQFSEQDAATLFIFIVELMSEKTPKPISGFKDNGILEHLRLYHNFFPTAQYINVVRDPRDMALSAWHHNMRVEENFISRAHSLEEWVVNMAASWSKSVDAVDEYYRNTVTVRYEDLLSNGKAEMEKVFQFLNADPKHAGAVIEATDFKKLKNTKNEFFRKGQAGGWKSELDAEMLAGIEEKAGKNMRRLGYAQGD